MGGTGKTSPGGFGRRGRNLLARTRAEADARGATSQRVARNVALREFAERRRASA